MSRLTPEELQHVLNVVGPDSPDRLDRRKLAEAVVELVEMVIKGSTDTYGNCYFCTLGWKRLADQDHDEDCPVLWAKTFMEVTL